MTPSMMHGDNPYFRISEKIIEPIILEPLYLHATHVREADTMDFRINAEPFGGSSYFFQKFQTQTWQLGIIPKRGLHRI
jgi:hypothetical protein